MSMELSNYLKQQLRLLAPTHPDKEYLERLLAENEVYLREHFYNEMLPEKAQRFTDAARKSLEEQGFAIYGLTGRSVGQLMEMQNIISWGSFLNNTGREIIQQIHSRMSEVAINPDPTKLVGTNIYSEKQDQLLEDTQERLSAVVPDVKVVLGSVADYAELSFMHFATTSKHLLPYYERVRTITSVEYRHHISISGYHPGDGIVINNTHNTTKSTDLGILPLIFPQS